MPEPYLTRFYSSWELAEADLLENIARTTSLKVSESAGARTSSWRNGMRGMTRENDILWIDPEIVPFYQKTFQCVFHKRTRAAHRGGVSDSDKQGKRISLDKGCLYRTVLTTVPLRAKVSDDFSYHVKVQVFTHPQTPDQIVYADGHNHDNQRTADSRHILVQNKRLTREEKARVLDLSGLGLRPRAILRDLGGADAERGRTRTTKAIANVVSTDKLLLYGKGSPVSVDMDLTIKYLIRCQAKFWLYCERDDTEEFRLSESDFIDNREVLLACNGARFKDLHVLFPGSDRVAAMFGDCVSVDSTHNMCAARFPLYLGMVADANGKGHIVTISVLTSETARAVGHALQFQKQRAGLTHRSILLDKDGSEFSAISSILPHASLVLCRFHAIKYFRLVMATTYLPAELREAAIAEWRNMVYSNCEAEFLSAWEMLQSIVRDVGPICRLRYPCSPPTVIAYIIKNWLPMKKHWVFHLQQHSLTRGSFTTNRNEGKHSTLRKDDLGTQKTIYELFQRLRDIVLMDLQAARDMCAQKMLSDDRSAFFNNVPCMPLLPDLCNWFGNVAEEHILLSWKHATTRSYDILRVQVGDVIWHEHRAGSWISFTLSGFTFSSSCQEVALFCSDLHAVERLRQSMQLSNCFRIESILFARCIASCGEFSNFGGMPCRHVLFVLKRTVETCEPNAIPIHVGLFQERDLNRPCHKVLHLAVSDLKLPQAPENSNLLASSLPQSEGRRLLSLQKLPMFTSRTASDAITAKFMSGLKDGAEILEALKSRGDMSFQTIVHFTAWLKSFLHLLQATKKPVTEHQTVSLWDIASTTRCDQVIPPLLSMKEFAREIAELGDPRGKSLREQSEGRVVSEWGVTVVTNFVYYLFNRPAESESRFAEPRGAAPLIAAINDNAHHECLRLAIATAYRSVMCTVPSRAVPASGTKSSVLAAVNASPAVGMIVVSRKQKRRLTRGQAEASRVEKQLRLSENQHLSQGIEHLQQILDGAERSERNAGFTSSTTKK